MSTTSGRPPPRSPQTDTPGNGGKCPRATTFTQVPHGNGPSGKLLAVMRERESPRSAREDRARAERRAVPSAANAEAILALQRSAGNRALVQRLAYNEINGSLLVPSKYASQEITWDGERVPSVPQAGQRRPLLEHAGNANFKQALA